MANIDIASLFSDIVPNPEQQQRERVLQQNDAVNQANLVGTLGGMAAYYGPERSRALQQSATGLLGIDTRTESQKAMEQLKDAKIDLSSREGLIKAANIYQNIDPIKAAQLRTQAAALKTEEDKAARLAIENQQKDATFAMNQAAGLEDLTSRVTTREEVGQQRTANSTLIDNSTVLSETEQTNYKALINSGAFDGKQADLLKITNPSPLIFGNNAVVKDADGNWKSIVAPAPSKTMNGLLALADLSFTAEDPKGIAVKKAIQEGSITTMTQLKSVLPENKERADIPVVIEKSYEATSEIARNAFVSNIRIDGLLNTIADQDLLNYDTAGAFSSFRTSAFNVLGKRDEIEQLRTAYTRERNTEIVTSLPKGTASDRDIAIFSAGFPPENAGMREIYAYLTAAKNINNLNQEYNDLLGMYINTQADSGVKPTKVGFDAEFKKYVSASKVLNSKIANYKQLGNSATQADQEALSASVNLFEDTYGKLPIDVQLGN